jgi:hypothetical protein
VIATLVVAPYTNAKKSGASIERERRSDHQLSRHGGAATPRALSGYIEAPGCVQLSAERAAVDEPRTIERRKIDQRRA